MKNKTALEIIKKLRQGGKIVSTGSLSTASISHAQACSRIFVDNENFGYVYLPDSSNQSLTALTKEHEAEMTKVREYEITFGPHFELFIEVTANDLKVKGAVNGYGDSVIDSCQILELAQFRVETKGKEEKNEPR